MATIQKQKTVSPSKVPKDHYFYHYKIKDGELVRIEGSPDVWKEFRVCHGNNGTTLYYRKHKRSEIDSQ